MEINLIWAQDLNGGIGKKGQLPWHISEDLQNFKKITIDSVIIMGRKTWESLPIKPLPNRRNIVLSGSRISNVEVYHSIDDCLSSLEKELVSRIFIIGGAAIYKSFFSYASYLHITFVNMESDNIDTFFPISMKEIENYFTKNIDQKLSKDATYTLWSKK